MAHAAAEPFVERSLSSSLSGTGAHGVEKSFAPGHEALASGDSASNFAPGHEKPQVETKIILLQSLHAPLVQMISLILKEKHTGNGCQTSACSFLFLNEFISNSTSKPRDAGPF
jgi:hypothetical protein